MAADVHARMVELYDVLSHNADWREFFNPPVPKGYKPKPAPPKVDKGVKAACRDAEQRVERYLQENGQATTVQMMQALFHEWHTVKRCLEALRAKGIAYKTGAGRTTMWHYRGAAAD